jgi:hypothetical protein
MSRGDERGQSAMNGEETVTMSGKGIFLFGLAIVGAIIVLGVYQVPQPWRGVLVVWLLFMGTGGIFILRVIRHLVAYKSLKLEQATAQGRWRTTRSRRRSVFQSRPRQESLRIVHTRAAGAGRHVVR